MRKPEHRTAVVLFTRDLRLHDQPALTAAVERAERVLPLFVLDDHILAAFGAPNRVAFLLDSLADLDARLHERGAALVVRRGDVVEETVRVARDAGAEAVHLSEDVSAYAQERERRLRQALAGVRIELRSFPGVSVVPPGDVTPADADHYRVFTPYWRRWSAEPWREVLAAPERLQLPDGVEPGPRPELEPGPLAPELPKGGETAGRRRLERWLANGLAGYAKGHDDLAGNRTSRLSPYLHFGCVSPLEVAERSRQARGESFVRQLCWRDFYTQLLAARPELSREDMRSREPEWTQDDEGLAVWKEGRTGVPLVDAGMKQLLQEGWMHNRARMVVGSYLTKHLGIDWRAGAAHFYDHLVDGDVANNAGNWQWVAGTGTDTRPYRKLSPQRQAERHDPDGAYILRYAPEHAAEQLTL